MGFFGEHHRTCQPDVCLLHDIFDNLFQMVFSSGNDVSGWLKYATNSLTTSGSEGAAEEFDCLDLYHSPPLDEVWLDETECRYQQD
jgi:hypothetical protein